MRDAITTAMEVAGLILASAAVGCAVASSWALCVFLAGAGVSLFGSGVVEGKK